MLGDFTARKVRETGHSSAIAGYPRSCYNGAVAAFYPRTHRSEPATAKKTIEAGGLTWLARVLDIYMVGKRVNPEKLIGNISSLERPIYPEGAGISGEIGFGVG